VNLSLSEEQEILKQSARDFLEEKCPKSFLKQMEKDEKGYSPEMWQEMADLGWQGLVLPEQYGGSEMTFLDLAVLLEEMGRVCLPAPFVPTVVLGGLPVMDAGSEEQKARYLPEIASGKAIFSMALIEPELGYEPTAIKAEAKAEGDSFVINGTKLFVPYANVADYLLVAARTSAKVDGVTVFIVDAKSDGIKILPLTPMSHENLGEVVFENVKVSGDCVLGGVDQGWPVVQKAWEKNDAARCCELAGNFQWVMDDTIAYVLDRKQFGKPIGSFQVLQHYCADMSTYLEGTKLAAHQAAWAVSECVDSERLVAVAKAWVNQVSAAFFNLSHQLHGAMGVTVEHDLHYYTTRAKVVGRGYGEGNYYREIVAKSIGLG
jgi:3-oxocholest-4-en-26-oyl-CoA dehydrogenase beta subunit